MRDPVLRIRMHGSEIIQSQAACSMRAHAGLKASKLEMRPLQGNQVPLRMLKRIPNRMPPHAASNLQVHRYRTRLQAQALTGSSPWPAPIFPKSVVLRLWDFIGIKGSHTLATMTDQIRLQKGSLIVYRVFDVAEEINLAKVAEIANKETRLKLLRTGHHAVIIRNAPMVISLGETQIRLGTHTLKAEISGKLWDYGVASVAFQIALPAGMTWSQLLQISADLNPSPVSGMAATADTAKQIDLIASRKASELASTFASAFKRPSQWDVSEDYNIFYLEKVEGISNPRELLERADVPALLLSEAEGQLSDQSRAGLFDYVYQYAKDDMVIIDWNSALVLEPSGQREVVDVLEFVVTQLLEMRYYDDLLDHRLTELYDTIEAKRGRKLGGYFSHLAHEANTRYLEFAEVLERVNNSLKVVGDFYLAVIFRASLRRFRVPDWQASITRKMDLLAKTTELLQGETNVVRSHLLEATIIVLILFEIVSAMIKH